jgi:hypothetical protein
MALGFLVMSDANYSGSSGCLFALFLWHRVIHVLTESFARSFCNSAVCAAVLPALHNQKA